MSLTWPHFLKTSRAANEAGKTFPSSHSVCGRCCSVCSGVVSLPHLARLIGLRCEYLHTKRALNKTVRGRLSSAARQAAPKFRNMLENISAMVVFTLTALVWMSRLLLLLGAFVGWPTLSRPGASQLSHVMRIIPSLFWWTSAFHNLENALLYFVHIVTERHPSSVTSGCPRSSNWQNNNLTDKKINKYNKELYK